MAANANLIQPLIILGRLGFGGTICCGKCSLARATPRNTRGWLDPGGNPEKRNH